MVPAQYYYPIYIHLILLLSLIQYFKIQARTQYALLYTPKEKVGIIFICIFLILFVGLRPISYIFVDTANYARIYSMYRQGVLLYDSGSSEWLFNLLMFECSKSVDVKYFFLMIEALYIVPMIWGCQRLIPKNTTSAIIFCLGAFSFFAYGVNGIRNGMACSLIILALSFINGTQKEKIVTGLLCFCAYNIHHSTALPILCMLIAYFYRNTRMIIYFWIGSILISLVAGGAVESFFAGLGFDDRLSDYINNHAYDDSFSSTGFRWDFLLYSAMPIWLGWYVVIKKRISDRNYLLLLNTYILCNAFWVMLIRASFSNRFAYLSWFMYPLVLAYPLLCFPIKKEQGRWVGLILVLHCLFTYLMWIRG